MKLEKLYPWNWFKHEESHTHRGSQVPAAREDKEPLSYPDFFGLHREMVDRLFGDSFAKFGWPGLIDPESKTPKWADMYRPQLDVSCDDKQYQITIDLPGLTESDISIDVNDDILTISGEKEEKSENKDKHFYRVERKYGSFKRTLSLPSDANADDISANLKDGVLTLTINRQELETPSARKISISH